ncbi:hypothetical protein OG689_43345 [Kitasatospora sp. NBC_00240]|uniref:hypothetical protein n=1 Tax=Kitasatospora sp. NBC_00240 TaxID=2903567 RepID=UPI00225405C4|nr:hypothetical protein [Kitasatospora sp. NBC_00240]MCX5215977.1 hypothetical protein [Kitasatospora sp. NBC_00240]
METSLELATLASVASARLIDMVATDGWAAVRAAVSSLWRRSHPERAEEELGEARDRLLASQGGGDDQNLRALLVAVWQAKLALLLATEPDLADEVRQLISEELRGSSPVGQVVGSLNQEAHVTDGDAYLAGRDITVTRDGRQ